MSYICVKKLSLGGKTYFPGGSIPEDAFASGRAAKLKAYGYVTEAAEPGVEESLGSPRRGRRQSDGKQKL